MEESLERPLQAPRYNFDSRAAAARMRRLLTDQHAAELVDAADRIGRTLFRYQARRDAEQQLHEYFHDLLSWPDGLLYYDEPRLRGYVEAMRTCRTHGAIGIKKDGRPVIAWQDKCNCLRLCPDEARQDQVRVLKQYIAAILAGKAKGWRVYKLVFSPRNYPRGDLHAAKRDVFAQWKAFRRMVRRGELALPGIMGELIIQEDPMGASGDWNVHLNVILLYNGYMEYERVHALLPEDQVKISSERDMLRETRRTLRSRGIDADELSDEEVLTAAIKECIKYPVQAISAKSLEHADAAGAWVDGEYLDARGDRCAPPMTEWPKAAAMEWWMANKGFRRVRSYGCLYDCKRPELEDELDQDTHWIATIQYFDGQGYSIYAPWLPQGWDTEFGAGPLLSSIRRGTSRQKVEGEKPETGPPPDRAVLAVMLQEAALRHYMGDHYDEYAKQTDSEYRARLLAASTRH